MAVYLRGGRYYYEFQYRGIKYRRVCTGCRTKAQAQQMEEFARAKVIIEPDMPRGRAPLLSEFSKAFLAHIDKRIAAGSLKSATRVSYIHGCRLLSETRVWKLRISEITRSRAAELSFPGTGWNANHALRTLRAMLGYAEECSIIRTAPHIALRSVEGRERLFAPWEEELVLKHASPILSDILAIIFNCGLRPQSEACALKWEDINWVEHRILIQRGKSKQARRYVGITERMRAVLENCKVRNEQAGLGDSPYVFPSQRSEGGHRVWLAAMWAATLKRIAAAGIVLAPGLVPYSARHTYATNYLQAGGDIGQLARLMGHSDISTTLRYVHLIEASASAKVMDSHNDKLKIMKKESVMTRRMDSSPVLRGNPVVRYILDDHGEAVPEPDLFTWAHWAENPAHRRVAFDDLGERGRVSTVFLALDHSFSADGPPVLWESMVFGGPLDQEQRRYRSRAEALVGHAALLRAMRKEKSISRKNPTRV